MAVKSEFKESIPFEARKKEADRIKTRYPDRVPVILERHNKSTLPKEDKKKYLVPNDLTLGQFIYIIRKRIKIPAHQALFLFVNEKLFSSSDVISQVYNSEKDQDSFLYAVYTNENTFGN